MASARPSVTKRQREQKKRDKKAAKAERRAERKNERAAGIVHEDETPDEFTPPSE